MKKILIFTILLFINSSSYADYTVLGNFKCGSLLQFVNDKNTHVKTAITSWMEGYLTGRNYELDRDMLGKPNSDSLYHAVLKFCNDEPLSDLESAALHIDSKLNN